MDDRGESSVDQFPPDYDSKIQEIPTMPEVIATAVAAAVQAQADGTDPYEAALEAVNNGG